MCTVGCSLSCINLRLIVQSVGLLGVCKNLLPQSTNSTADRVDRHFSVCNSTDELVANNEITPNSPRTLLIALMCW